MEQKKNYTLPIVMMFLLFAMIVVRYCVVRFGIIECSAIVPLS